MSQLQRSAGGILIGSGAVLGFIAINDFDGAGRFTMGEALGNMLNFLALFGTGIALIILGVAMRRDRDGKEKKYLTNEQAFILKVVCLLLIVFYVAYVPIHIGLSMEKGCNLHSSVMTLFPVRQFYLIPKVEREWNNLYTDARDGLSGLFTTVMAGAIEKPVMDIIKYGDCVAFHSFGEAVGELSPRTLTAEQKRRRPTPIPAITIPAAKSTRTSIFDTILTPPPKVPEFITIISTANLNIRTGPGTGYDRIGMLKKGDQATVTGRNRAGTWIQFDKGWVSARYVTAQGDLMTLPVIET